MKLLLSTLTACFALALLAERQPIERYQPIIDGCMFGKTPPGFDPTKPASEAPRSSGPAPEAEREEQRAQLMQIQEELRKAREARAALEAEAASTSDAEVE